MAYEAAYRTWQRTQTHRLASEANKRLVAFEAALDEPVAPNLSIRAASTQRLCPAQVRRRLSATDPSKVKPALLDRLWVETRSNDRSALQTFRAELRTCEPFKDGVASARMPGERADWDAPSLVATVVLLLYM